MIGNSLSQRALDRSALKPAWSPDGKTLAGFHWQGSEHTFRIGLYSFDNQSYRTVTDELGIAVSTGWLNDSRRLVFGGPDAEGGSIYLLDTETGVTEELLSSRDLAAEPGVQDGRLWSIAISPDSRDLYVHWFQVQSDIWMLTLGEQ